MSDPKTEAATEDREAADAAVYEQTVETAAATEANAADDAASATLEDFDDEDVEGESVADPKEQEIERLQGELAQARDQLMRAAADIQNTRKRAERDRREAESYGGTKLARDVIGVYDNLSKALSLVTEEMRAADTAFIEGLELTHREMLNAFAKHKIAPVSPEKGEKFDPNVHQAMFEAPYGDPGTVIEIVQDGFKIADRLLRPALVGVASAGARPAAEEKSPDADPAESDEASAS